MKLKAKNVGRFKSIELELNGLTVIAGTNSCGKTTLGKALYAAAKCETFLLENIVQKKKEVMEDILSNFEYLEMINRSKEGNAIVSDDNIKKIGILLRKANNKEKNLSMNSIQSSLDELVAILQNNVIRDMLDRFVRPGTKTSYDEVISILNSPVSFDNTEINRKLVEYAFQAEFESQISNFSEPNQDSIVSLVQDDGESNYVFKSGKCISCLINKPCFKNIVYLDDVYALDNLYHPPLQRNRRVLYRRRNFLQFDSRDIYSFDNDHRKDLISLLFGIAQPDYRTIAEDISLDKVTETFQSFFSKILIGNIAYSKDNRDYVYSENNEDILLRNTASGVKAIGIIELLFRNGYINNNSCLVIDEPETHLHPEWQIMLAELLVSLVKETSIKILLNTHSPYFLEAIRTYSKSKNVLEKTKFYHVVRTDLNTSTLVDVSNNIAPVFKVLAEPYRILDSIYKETI